MTLKRAEEKNISIFCNKEKCKIQQLHNSTIYPATNSPSASGKSKGTRAVSARNSNEMKKEMLVKKEE